MEIFTQENYYTIGNAKIYFGYDEEENGYELEWAEGETDNFIIPDRINGIDVKWLDSDDMDNFSGYDRVTVSEDNKYFKVIDDVLFSKDGKELLIYPHKKKNESYIIPSGVEIIDPCAFEYNQHLKNIIVPEGVTHIHQYAFATCSNVERIYLPSTLELVSLKTFYGCGNGNIEAFYGGTPEQWQKINFLDCNWAVQNAKINYNSPVPDIDENGFVFKEV